VTKFVKNEEFWQFNQNWDRRISSSILPKQDKRRSASSINELYAIAKLIKE
jgi:hypothetical protein